MRSVTLALAMALGGVAMGQTAINDNDCRITLTNAFNNLRILDQTNATAYSYGLRLDTTESYNGRNTTYTGWLKLYDDSNPTGELLKSELTLYRGSNLMLRAVADGKRVWSYDPTTNAYSVDAYNVETGTNAPHYRDNFVLLFKKSVLGMPQTLVTLMDQASITGTARVKDWLGGISFEGQQYVDANDSTHLYNVIWQKVPDSSRFVQFNTESHDSGSTWALNSVQIHRQETLGSSTKISDTYLTVAKDNAGTPWSFVSTSSDFAFVPPARSKVLATPRTVKF